MPVQGVDASVDRITRDAGDGSFYYWPLCKAGFDSSIEGNYASGGFNFHYAVRAASLRYDAAASYRYSYTGASWMNPVWDWPVVQHWQLGIGGGWWYGLCYDDNTVAVAPFQDNSEQPLKLETTYEPTQLE